MTFSDNFTVDIGDGSWYNVTMENKMNRNWNMDINQLVGKTIEFFPAIYDLESYAEGKMRAVVTDIVPMYTEDPDPREHVYKLFVNYAKYDEYNKQFESANYYDKSGVDCLTARQAGYYSVADVIYMPNPNVDSWDVYLKVID